MTGGAVDRLISSFDQWPERIAMICSQHTVTYAELRQKARTEMVRLKAEGIGQGDVVALVGDFDGDSIPRLLALCLLGAVIAPMTKSPSDGDLELLHARWVLSRAGELTSSAVFRVHPLIEQLKGVGHPGLLVLTSGSSGHPKVILHDVEKVMAKFAPPKRPQRLITFLLFDHMGGLNTLFHSLSSGSTAIFLTSRRPDDVASAIETYQVEVLPTTPSFLNLLLAHESHKRYSLESLKLITYGTEPMPEVTLERIRARLPDVKLLQTYGLSELGVLRTSSERDGSLLLKFNDPNIRYRIRNDMLELQSPTTMLGYLNAPSPLTADGWFMTGDYVEQHGDYLKIIGRKSELIIVAGDKFHPREVEDKIRVLDNVLEVTAYTEANPLVGQVVAVTVVLKEPENPEHFKKRLRAHCLAALPRTRLPRSVEMANHSLYSERMKKVRGLPSGR